MKVLRKIWYVLEAMAEGRRMRVDREVQEYIKHNR